MPRRILEKYITKSKKVPSKALFYLTSFLYWDGVFEKCFLKHLQKVLRELNPDSYAISVRLFLLVLICDAAYSDLTEPKYVRNGIFSWSQNMCAM